jgi:hypothetical protein
LGRVLRSRDQAWRASSDEGHDDALDHAATGLQGERSLEQTEELFRRLAPGFDGRMEIYRRVAVRVRVASPGAPRAIEAHVGREEGTAVRVETAGGGRGFGACAGGGQAACASALALALDGVVGPESDEPPWAGGGLGAYLDIDEGLALPPMREMRDWLERSLGETGRAASAWIEAATTVETIVADGGLRAERRRQRIWAVHRWLGPVREVSRTVAARRLADLDRMDRPDASCVGPAPDRASEFVTVAFSPEAAAGLTAALVRVLHRPDGPRSVVGPGWRVRDDPGRPDALFGGTFDDAGFPTFRNQLADGRDTVGEIGWAGVLRRGSYREPPEPMATSLVVEPPRIDAPRGTIWADDARIHPLSATVWLLEIDPGPRFLRVDPRDLVGQCVGGIGEPVQSARGVTTPALLFDGLRRVC